jgi:hypothetical protein
MPFPYTFPFWFDIAVRYTSVERVRYQTGLLTSDDMDDVTLKTLIEEAESIVDSWAKRDGVNNESWAIEVPTLIIHVATVKAGQMALARKALDARIAATEFRSGASATMPSTEGPEYLRQLAQKDWEDFLVATGRTPPATQKFTVKAEKAGFSEKNWRKKKKATSS